MTALTPYDLIRLGGTDAASGWMFLTPTTVRATMSLSVDDSPVPNATGATFHVQFSDGSPDRFISALPTPGAPGEYFADLVVHGGAWMRVTASATSPAAVSDVAVASLMPGQVPETSGSSTLVTGDGQVVTTTSAGYVSAVRISELELVNSVSPSDDVPVVQNTASGPRMRRTRVSVLTNLAGAHAEEVAAEVGAAAGAEAGAIAGAQAGEEAGATAGTTAGSVAGAEAGATAGAVSGAAAGAAAGASAGRAETIALTTVPPAFSAAVARPALNVLTDVLSPRNWGAKIDGETDDSLRIEAMISDLEPGMTIEWPEGTCVCATEMPIWQPDVQMRGKTTRFQQQSYGYSAFQLLADGARVSGFDLRQVNARGMLPETPATRFLGDPQRARVSAVYISGSNCTVEDVYAENWINAVNLAGGERHYAVSPELPTPSSVKLTAADARSEGFYVGWTVRLLSTAGGSSSTVVVTGYDASTNTVSAPFDVQLSGSVYYSLIGPASTGNRIRGLRGRNLDFGVLLSNYGDAEIHDIDIRHIQQTQQTNVRPHFVYGSGNNNHDQAASILRGSRWSGYDCRPGSAYKIRNVKQLALSDVTAYKTRGVLEIETVSDASVSGVRGFDVGNIGNRPFSLRVVDSKIVSASDIYCAVDPAFDALGLSATRPAAVWLVSDAFGQPLDRTSAVSIRNVTGVFRGNPDNSYLLFCELADYDTASVAVDGLTAIRDGYEGAIAFARMQGVDGGRIAGLRHLGGGAVPSIVLDSSAKNITVEIDSAGVGAVPVSNAGTGNKILRDGSLRGTGTPILVGESTAGTNAYSVQLMEWCRTGDIVDVRVRIEISTLQSTGNLRVEGLPYTVSSDVAGYRAAALLGAYSGFTLASGRLPAAIAAAGTTRVDLIFVANDQQGRLTSGMLGTTPRIDFSLSYRTDDPY